MEEYLSCWNDRPRNILSKGMKGLDSVSEAPEKIDYVTLYFTDGYD